jgi:ApaG protein
MVENRAGCTILAIMYVKVTRDIRVAVEPEFVEKESHPSDSKFVWAYRIQIQNIGTETVQLLTRHWIISDANGNIQEVNGDGVVGRQPTLPPGATFEYQSGCPLTTPSGMMMGKYTMVSGGESFAVEIPAFSLDSPHDSRVLN